MIGIGLGVALVRRQGPAVPHLLFSGSLAEGSAEDTAVASVTLVDPQSAYGAGTYSITAQNRANWFKISSAGAVKAGSTLSDFETDPAPTITVQFDDGVLTPLSRQFTVTITDVAAPTLTSPTATETGATTADLGVTTNKSNGTLYVVVTTSATAPSAAQVKAGQDHTGSAAAFDDSQSISSTGAKTFSATGLSASTAYYAHFMHEGLPAEQSAVVSSAVFTTEEVTIPDAPTLVWVSDGSDNTPVIDLTAPTPADLIVGDVVHYQFDTVNTFDSGDLVEDTNTVDSGEAAALELNFTIGALADGTWYARARIERSGSGNSDWSNIVSQTIATVPTSPPATALWGWWDAEHSYTETSGTPTTLVTVDSTAIGSQIDRSGSGHHLYHSGSPVFKTNRLNSLPAVSFNGTDQFLQTTAGGPTGDAFTMFVVANRTSAVANAALVANDYGPLAVRYGILMNGSGGVFVKNNDDGTPSSMTVDDYHLVSGSIDNSGSFPGIIQIDNNTAVSTNLTGGGGLGELRVGHFFNAYWPGDIVEVLIYTSVLDFASGDGLLARKYLNAKYNLGLTL